MLCGFVGGNLCWATLQPEELTAEVAFVVRAEMNHLREGDEDGFVDYAETVINTMQRLAREKHNGKNHPLEFTPVLETCVRLEELAYRESLQDFSLHGTQGIWSHAAALDLYQDICSSMIRNLEQMSIKNSISKFQENPPASLFYMLTGRQRGGGAPTGLGGRDPKPGRLAPKGYKHDDDEEEPNYGLSKRGRKRKSGGGGGGGKAAKGI